MPTAAQIMNQVDTNNISMEKLKAQWNENLPAYRKAQIEQQLQSLWQAQSYWTGEYQKVTGHPLVVFYGLTIEGDPNAWAREQAEQKLTAEARAKKSAEIKQARQAVDDATREVNQEYQRLRVLLQDQYDIATHWYNAFFSDLARMTTGLDARHPLRIKKTVEDNAWPLIMAAEKARDAGDYSKALSKAAAAAKHIRWGFDRLASFLASLEEGASHAVAGIKVSAALATLIVSAPVAGLTALEQAGVGMALAVVGEGAQQGTTLILKGIDPAQSVSANDLKNAALSVAVNWGAAGLGSAFGALVGKALAKQSAQRILGEVLTKYNRMGSEPSEEALKFATEEVAKRVEQYVAANSQSIVNKMLKLDSDPDWNWWYMAVAPALNTANMEMVKDPALKKLVTQ